jgi:hypothetical protein
MSCSEGSVSSTLLTRDTSGFLLATFFFSGAASFLSTRLTFRVRPVTATGGVLFVTPAAFEVGIFLVALDFMLGVAPVSGLRVLVTGAFVTGAFTGALVGCFVEVRVVVF